MRRILPILFFLTAIFYSLFPKIALAAPSAYPLNTNPDVPQNMHTYTQSVFIEIAAAISCQLTGVDPTNPNGKCLGIDPKTNKIGFVEGGGGAIGMMGQFISMTFYIPVSTHDYGSYLASNFGITKRTYAANEAEGGGGTQTQLAGPPETSLGYNALLPTLNLWKTFRNITYLFFVILFVIIGLGIMFRIKIDPRTVMSIQNQIPKIIAAIVFVTLSYAIAGFLIDLMYVFIYLIVSIFVQQGINPGAAFANNPFGAAGGIGGISGIASGVAKSISGIVSSIFDGTLGRVIGVIIGGIIGNFFGSPMSDIPLVGGFLKTGAVVGGIVGGLIGGNRILGLIAGVIAYLVIVIAIFSALLRLWFVLIKSYIYVLITVVFAPFYIAYGLIPGRSGIGNWIKSMAANLVVFPATITMFLLGQTFIAAFGKGNPTNAPFTPPLVGDFLDSGHLASIIGLGIILLTPEVANIARDTLKAPELKYTAAIGKGLGVGAGVASAPMRGIAGEFFGTDRMGRPKAATKWISDRFGRLAGSFFGGRGATFSESTPLIGSAESAARRARDAFNSGRRRERPPEGPEGRVEGPELPPR